MLRFALFAGLLALPVSGAAGQDDPNKKDLQQLQGKWELVSATYNGKASSAASISEDNVWTIIKSKVIYPPPRTGDGKVAGPSDEVEISLDAAKKPKAMDLRQTRKGKETKLEAIYALQGDQLKICVDSADKGRPEEFDSKPGSGRNLILLKRVKE